MPQSCLDVNPFMRKHIDLCHGEDSGLTEEKVLDSQAIDPEPMKEDSQDDLKLTRSEYFKLKLKSLEKSADFVTLQKKCTILKEEFEQYPLTPNEHVSILDCKLSADKVALSLMPDQNKERLPVNVIGDGNCLARSGSIIAFGHESAHEECVCVCVYL